MAGCQNSASSAPPPSSTFRPTTVYAATPAPDPTPNPALASLEAKLAQLRPVPRQTGPDWLACNRLAQDVGGDDVAKAERIYVDCVMGNLP